MSLCQSYHCHYPDRHPVPKVAKQRGVLSNIPNVCFPAALNTTRTIIARPPVIVCERAKFAVWRPPRRTSSDPERRLDSQGIPGIAHGCSLEQGREYASSRWLQGHLPDHKVIKTWHRPSRLPSLTCSVRNAIGNASYSMRSLPDLLFLSSG